MLTTSLAPILAQPFSSVKPQLNTQFPLFPDSVIHHKVLYPHIVGKTLLDIKNKGKRYGVSSASKLLPVSLFRKKYDLVKLCLKSAVGLPDCQVEAIMRLLRVQAYYGSAYPKAAQIAGDFQDPPAAPFIPYPGYVPPQRHHWATSRATFWRAIRQLKELGLVMVINRYLIRPHAQISNLYRLDKLLILIARYLAEHGQRFNEKWLRPFLLVSGSLFWHQYLLPGRRSPPHTTSI